MYSVVFVFGVQPSDSVIHMHMVYLLFFRFFGHRGYCIRSSRVPCAEIQVLLDYLLYIYLFLCIHYPDFLIYPSPFPLLLCNPTFVF